MSKTKTVWRCSPAENKIEKVEVYADTPIDEWNHWYGGERYIYADSYEDAVYFMLTDLRMKEYRLKQKIAKWKMKGEINDTETQEC